MKGPKFCEGFKHKDACTDDGCEEHVKGKLVRSEEKPANGSSVVAEVVGSTGIECNDVLGSTFAGACCSKESTGPSGSPCCSETLSYCDRPCAVSGRGHLCKVKGLAT